jgi:hypothetical protein
MAIIIDKIILCFSFGDRIEIPFPQMASNGMTNKYNIGIPPNKFPTKTLGLFTEIAEIPTAISGVDVKIPKTIKEIKN